MNDAFKYELSKDGLGLLKYVTLSDSFYHVHSNEMSELERWIHSKLLAEVQQTRIKNPLNIYCAHPISGYSADEIFDYYTNIQTTLESYGYNVFTPLYTKSDLRTEIKFKELDYRQPTSTNHAIYRRDSFMVTQADVIFANFLKATHVSIGSMMELGWASYLHKHTILVMEKDNIHRHAFVMEAADIIFETQEEAMEYLRKLSLKEY